MLLRKKQNWTDLREKPESQSIESMECLASRDPVSGFASKSNLFWIPPCHHLHKDYWSMLEKDGKDRNKYGRKEACGEGRHVPVIFVKVVGWKSKN